MPKLEKDLTFIFPIKNFSPNLIPYLKGEKRVQINEIFAIQKAANHLNRNLSEAFATQNAPLKAFAPRAALIFFLLLGLGMIAGGAVAVKYGADSEDVGAVGTILLICGAMFTLPSILSCLWRQRDKGKLTNILQTQNKEGEIQQLEGATEENTAQISYQQAEETRISIQEELSDEGNVSSEEGLYHQGLFKNSTDKGKEEEDELSEPLLEKNSNDRNINCDEKRPLLKK